MCLKRSRSDWMGALSTCSTVPHADAVLLLVALQMVATFALADPAMGHLDVVDLHVSDLVPLHRLESFVEAPKKRTPFNISQALRLKVSRCSLDLPKLFSCIFLKKWKNKHRANTTTNRAFHLDETHGFPKVSTSPRRGACFLQIGVQNLPGHSGPFCLHIVFPTRHSAVSDIVSRNLFPAPNFIFCFVP